MIDLPRDPRPPLTPLRVLFVILGGLILTVTGGCTLILGLPGFAYGAWQAVLFYGGIPIAAGLLILSLALWWRRGGGGGAQDEEEEPNG